MNDDFDELDRALFALPLETPPPGLRQAILNATIFAQQRVTTESAVRPWEAWAVGGAFAVAVWLVYALIAYKGFALAFTAETMATARSFAEPSTLVWLGAGAAVAAWLLFFNSLGLRLPLRGARP
jgi:hypothetical protein